jgi:hypothetical protein
VGLCSHGEWLALEYGVFIAVSVEVSMLVKWGMKYVHLHDCVSGHTISPLSFFRQCVDRMFPH